MRIILPHHLDFQEFISQLNFHMQAHICLNFSQKVAIRLKYQLIKADMHENIHFPFFFDFSVFVFKSCNLGRFFGLRRGYIAVFSPKSRYFRRFQHFQTIFHDFRRFAHFGYFPRFRAFQPRISLDNAFSGKARIGTHACIKSSFEPHLAAALRKIVAHIAANKKSVMNDFIHKPDFSRANIISLHFQNRSRYNSHQYFQG